MASGQEGIALWGWQRALSFPRNMPQTTDPPPNNAATGSEEAGTTYFSRGVRDRHARAGVAKLSEAFFPDPKRHSPPRPAPPYPPLQFSRKYCSYNYRKLKGKNKGCKQELLPLVPFASQP